MRDTSERLAEACVLLTMMNALEVNVHSMTYRLNP